MTRSSYFWMRSAGFSFDWLHSLSILDKSDELTAYLESFSALVRLDTNVRNEIADRCPEVLQKLDRKMKARVAVVSSELPLVVRGILSQPLAERSELLAALAASKTELAGRFEQEVRATKIRIMAYLSDPATREAIFLSNPNALERIDALVEHDVDAVDSRSRQRLRLAWNYLQRFCAKNDTTSFFGPIAWGRFLQASEPAIHVVKDDAQWIAERKTFVEHWVIERLAAAINRDSGLAPFLPVSLDPGCFYCDGVLHVPIAKTVVLEPLGVALLGHLADGGKHRRTALAAHCVAQGFEEGDVDCLLDFLIAKKVLNHGFLIAPGGSDPLARLRALLGTLPANLERCAFWRSILDELDGLRSIFAEGDLETRIQTRDAIGSLLDRSGINTERVQGQMYVGRFAVYEDCARNIEIEFGGAVTQAIDDEMRPLMGIYRWLAGAIMVRMQDQYRQTWGELIEQNVGKTGGSESRESVDFLRFLSTVARQQTVERVVAQLEPIMRTAWRSVLAPHDGADEVVLEAKDIELLLALLHKEESRAVGVSAIGVRTQSPDFMIAARDVNAIARGEFDIVIGEVHPGVHTVSQPVAQPFCPFANEIGQELGALLGPRTMVLADSAETYQRSHIDWLVVPELMQILLPGSAGRVPAAHTVAAGAGEVVLRDGVLHYRDRCTGVEQDLLTAMPSDFHRACFSLAGQALAQAEWVRLRFGRTIVKRRSWQFAGAELPVVKQACEQLDSFLEWQVWAQGAQLPRYVFVKSPTEPKPVYVDFRNPLSLDLLSSLRKNDESLRFSEMLPAPDDLWLQDGRGSFCCEFRTSFVDVS